MSFIKEITLNAKHLFGWKTNRKIIVFSVDDYGNVRLNSKEARFNMDKMEMKIYSRFDLYDTLETKEDLTQLFAILESVKDKNGRHPVFTTFSMTCNINFEKMQKDDYKYFYNETVPETFEKLSKQQPKAYVGAWNLFRQGISKGLVKPQFHGREHLNLIVFKDKLQKRDKELLCALENKSYTSISYKDYPTMSSMAAFDFWDIKDNEAFIEIIQEGLELFEKIYGYKSNYFTPPVNKIHHSLFKTLAEKGIRFIDLAMTRKEHQGLNVFKKTFNYLGKKAKDGLIVMVRNVVFEPTEDRGINWVEFTMKQIETAFRWNKPAIISSHRVNFCGHIDENNRNKGLKTLKNLLDEIVKKWPDVEFMSADELGEYIYKTKLKH